MVKRKLGALEKIEADLPNLQDKIRRDPLSYRADFENQWAQYQSYRSIILQTPASIPAKSLTSFCDLVDFVSHVASCYSDISGLLPQELIDILTKHHQQLTGELNEKIVTSLVLLRRKSLIDSITLLNALFPVLISTQSKTLRTLLYHKIIVDVRFANSKKTDHRVNRSLQSTLHHMISSDPTAARGLWAVRIVRELWRRQIWTDSKAVEIMKEAALAYQTKVVIGGVEFFLGGDKEREDAAQNPSDEEDAVDMQRLKHHAGITKKTAKTERNIKKAKKSVKKQERKRHQPDLLNFSALHLLHDPQTFAELLFSRHVQGNKSNLNLEQKVQVLQLVSRLVGLHKLIIMPLYSYFVKFLTPRQVSVTSFLASLAQATHSLVPPDTLEPLLQKIANEFVSEASAGPVAAAGINAIREICARQPLAMTETLLQDLILYRKSKDKGIMMAAKGLLSLYREFGPEMLHRRDRGREAALDLQAGQKKQVQFGEITPGQIDGIELLQKWKQDQRQHSIEEKRLDDHTIAEQIEDDEGWDNWEVQSDSSDSSGGWIDVSSDGENVDISDSDDETKPAVKRLKHSDQPLDENFDASKTLDLEEGVNQSVNTPDLATTRILTPADLVKLNELRQTNAALNLLPHQKKARNATIRAADRAKALQRHAEEPFTATDLEEASKLGVKTTKDEKVAMAKADRQEPHKRATARRKEKKLEAGKSSTNKEKARQKNFLMTLGKARGKQKRSLREVGKVLRGHVERSKRGGKRGNR